MASYINFNSLLVDFTIRILFLIIHEYKTKFEHIFIGFLERQIATRSKKLKKVYKKWEKTHFPDPAMKKKVKNILVTEYKKNEKKKSRADRKKN